MPNENLQRTALYRSHLQLGARLVQFAGYEMPVSYTSILDETKQVRSHCGLFDVSHMGQFSLRGESSLEELQKLVTNDLSKTRVGQAQYNILCNERGGTIDDLVVYHRTDDHAYVCVNASNRKKDFEWIRAHLSSKVTLEDESDATSLLALQGPNAEEILKKARTKVSSLKYYRANDTNVFDFPCYLSRTGYTGEDGFELYLKNEHALSVWERLIELGRKWGLVPCGLGARDTLRTEMGYALYGHELNETTSPLSAGLGWIVKFDKGSPFVGEAALQKEKEKGSEKILKAFKIADRRIARQGSRITEGNHTPVGEITSGTFSPHLNMPIALGFVRREFTMSETYCVEVRESLLPLTVTPLPFVPARNKKT